MKNMFKNAYFGKAYKTRDGRKAIYHMFHETVHELILPDGILLCKSDGTQINESERDIISEWQDFANDEEFEELANKIYPCWCSSENVNCDICIHPKLIEAFKNGCRKAKELLTHNDHDPKVKFTFDDVLAIQCCMETAKKVQEDEELYKQLLSLHDRLYDACHDVALDYQTNN